MKQESRAIIFDLDGTLADTWTVAFEVANETNLIGRPLTVEDYQHVRNLHVKEILEYLNIPIWRVPRLLVKGRAALASRITEVPLFPGMDDALGELKAQGYVLYVMSSNSLDNVQQFLKNHQIEAYFADVQGGVGVFAKAKSLKKLLKDHNLTPGGSYYVGDEVRDVEAAKKIGVHSIAVTWGFNGEKILKEYKPDYMVKEPKELVDIFKA